MTNSYFVFFKTQKAAAAAAQCSIFPEGALDAFQVVGAPGPEAVTCLTPIKLAPLETRKNVICIAGHIVGHECS